MTLFRILKGFNSWTSSFLLEQWQIKRARLVLPFLLPAYECSSSLVSCVGLVQFVNQVLPPLSEWDEVKLYVVLPLLASVIRNPSFAWNMLENATSSILMSMVHDLAQFIVSPDHVAHSRSAAASCLFSILVNRSEDSGNDVQTDDDHTIRNLLVEVVSPVLAKAVSRLKKEVGDSPTPEKSLHSAFCNVEEALDLMGVLVSCSDCILRMSSKTVSYYLTVGFSSGMQRRL